MADSGFSSKSSSQFIGKLGVRVFIVALIFLVIPLMVYSWINYLGDYFFRKKTLFVGLTSFATGKVRFAEQMIQDHFNEMKLLGMLIAKPNASQDFNKLFEQVAKEKNVVSLFYQAVQPNGQLMCTYSAQSELIGKKNLFSSQVITAQKLGQYVFLGVDPLSNAKEILLSLAITAEGSSQPIGVLTLGVDATHWLNWVSTVSASPVQFNLSLIDDEGEIFIQQSPQTSLTNDWIFPVSFSADAQQVYDEAMKTPQGSEYLHLLGRHDNRIGVKVPIPGTCFSLLLDSSQETTSVVPSSKVLSNLFESLFVFLVIGGGMALVITFRISRPLNALCAVMQKVEKGDLDARYHHDRMGFEINIIGHIFNQMIDSVIHHMDQTKTERVAKESLAKEWKIGREIQRSILPREKPDFSGVDIAIGFQEAKEVAGDFYDLFVRNPNELVLSVADAAGKGISACLYAFCVRSILRSFQVSEPYLSDIIKKSNNLFCKDTAESGNFVTAWVGILERETKRLHYSSCGHLPAILCRRDGTIEEHGTKGIALGVMPITEAETASIQLHSGDVLVLYTDGITESQDSFLEFFGKERLLDAIKAAKGKSAQQTVDLILERVNGFAHDVPLFDDRTLLVLRMT